MSIEPFVLGVDQVPLPPISGRDADRLRWMICVMNPDDKDLSFTASLLSHVLKKGCLSDKQQLYLERIWSRVHQEHAFNALRCQGDAA